MKLDSLRPQSEKNEI
uniref:Uncharacterized protein n=1 Tax=Arundo donax TaxID=35708 RepID=A0A0A8ZR75_ARUDO